MILRRLGFFIALLVGLAATQLPAFVIEYKQRLGGAIDELAAVVASFDSRGAQHGLTEGAAIDRKLASADPIDREEGEDMQANVQRLVSLREAQTAFRSAGPVARLGTFVTHYDRRIAGGTLRDFEPVVPTSAEAFVLGLLGFFVGGGALHVAGRPFRRRRAQALRDAEPAT